MHTRSSSSHGMKEEQPASRRGTSRSPSPHRVHHKHTTTTETEEAGASHGSDGHTVVINRAPVLTLWCAVVAHEGPSQLPWGKACMVGRKIAGMLAQSKGRSIGLYERKEELSDEEREERRRHNESDRAHGYRKKIAGFDIDLRELEGDSSAAENYVHHAFGEHLHETIETMKQLAAAYAHDDLDNSRIVYSLYEQFRPSVRAGIQGWGQKGTLDLDFIKQLANEHQQH